MPTLLFAALALIAQLSEPIPPTEATRPFEGSFTTQQAVEPFMTCISDWLDNWGKLKTYRTSEGYVIDHRMGLMPGPSLFNPKMRLTLVDNGAKRTLSATYGHPMPAGQVRSFFRQFARKCDKEAVLVLPK